jgi:hypothetical protein
LPVAALVPPAGVAIWRLKSPQIIDLKDDCCREGGSPASQDLRRTKDFRPRQHVEAPEHVFGLQGDTARMPGDSGAGVSHARATPSLSMDRYLELGASDRYVLAHWLTRVEPWLASGFAEVPNERLLPAVGSLSGTLDGQGAAQLENTASGLMRVELSSYDVERWE